jgi:hypothetical protein
MSAEEEQRKKMMDSMKAAGMSGQMFNKDDLKAQLDSLQVGGAGEVTAIMLAVGGCQACDCGTAVHNCITEYCCAPELRSE